jgi:hypothetical protein
MMLNTQGAQSQQYQQNQQQQPTAPTGSDLLTLVTDMQKPTLKQQLEARGEVSLLVSFTVTHELHTG